MRRGRVFPISEKTLPGNNCLPDDVMDNGALSISYLECNFMEPATQKSTWAIDPVHSKLRFDAKYLMISTVSGWFREIEGIVVTHGTNFDDSEMSLTIYTNSIYTGIEERDNHLRSADFFDALHFPIIRFRSTSVHNSENLITIKGDLTIKDITQPISFVARYLGSCKDPNGNTKAGFDFDISFDRKDFNITWNRFFDQQGVLISDMVLIHGDVQLLKLS